MIDQSSKASGFGRLICKDYFRDGQFMDDKFHGIQRQINNNDNDDEYYYGILNYLSG